MNFYDFKVKDKEGKEVSLKEYEGKVVLVVNTATECGLTPQYEGIENLYEHYESKGFVVLDFPCNQFLNQAPGSNDEIHEFCVTKYNTKFPRFAKVDVNGENADALYVWLKNQIKESKKDASVEEFEEKVKQYTPTIQEGDIKWNFGKFLINRQGEVIQRYSPATPPESLMVDIEKLL